MKFWFLMPLDCPECGIEESQRVQLAMPAGFTVVSFACGFALALPSSDLVGEKDAQKRMLARWLEGGKRKEWDEHWGMQPPHVDPSQPRVTKDILRYLIPLKGGSMTMIEAKRECLRMLPQLKKFDVQMVLMIEEEAFKKTKKGSKIAYEVVPGQELSGRELISKLPQLKGAVAQTERESGQTSQVSV